MKRGTRRSVVAGLGVLGALGLVSSTGAAPPRPAAKAVTAKIVHRTLTVVGNDDANQIVLRLKSHGRDSKLQVDVGNDGSADLQFDRHQFDSIVVDAGGGDDLVAIDESNGVFTDTERTTLIGGAGNDQLTGGSGAEVLQGGDGNDVIDGNGGADAVDLGAGDDTFVWNAGDGSDTVEGRDGSDTVLFNGSDVPEAFELSANGPRLRLTRDVGNVTMDVDGIETVKLDAEGGADTITEDDLSGTAVTEVDADLGAGDNQADQVVVDGTKDDDAVQITGGAGNATVGGLPEKTTVANAEPAFDSLTVAGQDGNDTLDASALGADVAKLVLDGGSGDDTLLGGAGADQLLGGDGNDFADGNGGVDTADLGAGDDTFRWDPGDGSDVVEGQDGNDTMVFNGSPAAEKFELAANGPRLRFTRDLGNIVMDVDGVETVQLNALGGSDTVTQDDLTGTAVTSLVADLGAGDNAADQVVVNGTRGVDGITVAGDASGVTVAGLASRVTIVHSEAGDALSVDGQDGNDRLDAQALAAGAIALTLDGGAGDDALAGSPGVDTLLGDDGNDTIDGNQGADVAFMGAGDDKFVWDPGDGSDVVDGQDGTDTMLFNGANVAEKFELSANGTRLRFTRDVGNITMDTNAVEKIQLNALGGADTVTQHDLTGTGVTTVELDLGAGDGAVDSVVLEGTPGTDLVSTTGDPTSGITVSGLAAQVAIAHAEPADRLAISGLAGDDALVAQGLETGVIALTLDGGDGNDVLVGSAGDDTLLGEAGDDILIGGPGLDTLDGGPGANTVIQ